MRRALFVFLLALGLAAGVLPPAGPAPARAQAAGPCLPAGGAGLPAHADVPSGQLQVLGRGWGHGVGMSQFGARGAARRGCDVATILGAYYPGTALAERADVAVRVSLYPDRHGGPGVDFLDVRAHKSTPDVEWRVRDGGEITLVERKQSAGEMWRATTVEEEDGTVHHVLVDLDPEEGQDEIIHRGSSAAEFLVELGQRDRTIQLPQKPTNEQWAGGRPYGRGELQIRPFGGVTRQLRVEMVLRSIDHYLYGLGEMPASWELQALQAQAIAGRSYAQRIIAATGRPLLDSPSDQVYNGLLQETAGSRWVEAVNTTARTVLTYQGGIAETYYSSSHGGQSENNAFSAFFSATNPLPYLRPVDDTRWEAAADSPVATWAHGYTLEEAGRLLDVGRVLQVRLLDDRGAGGRVGVPDRRVQHPEHGSRIYGGVEVVGTDATRKMSGLEFVQKLNVTRRSELFDVRLNVDLSCQPTESQADNTVVTRSWGPGRVETAATVSADHWDSAEDVVIATAGGQDDGYADALSAAAMAARLDAPLLLNGRSELAPEVLEELRRLSAERVRLMGGTVALSAEVEEQLEEAGFAVTRIAGEDRFETAREAALAAGASPSGDVVLALGTNWPDAVSAGTLAGSPDRVPTLLTQPDAVPDVSLRALEELEARRVLVVGGVAVVSDAVVQELRAAGYEVERLAGDSRFTTSEAVVREALERAPDEERPVLLASGEAFPDALAAGPLSARLGGPVALVPRCNLDGVPGTVSLLEDGPFDGGVIIGGVNAVSDRVRQQATDAVGG